MTVCSRGGAVKSVFIGYCFHNLSSFSSNDWTDGASTTDCGRLFHTSVLRNINDLFLMFNQHLSLNIFRLCSLAIESFSLM